MDGHKRYAQKEGWAGASSTTCTRELTFGNTGIPLFFPVGLYFIASSWYGILKSL